jgi:hypothetical protein
LEPAKAAAPTAAAPPTSAVFGIVVGPKLKARLAGSLDERILEEAGTSVIDDRPNPRSKEGVFDRSEGSDAMLLVFFLPKNPVNFDESIELCRFLNAGDEKVSCPSFSFHDCFLFLAQKNKRPQSMATAITPDTTPAMIPLPDDLLDGEATSPVRLWIVGTALGFVGFRPLAPVLWALAPFPFFPLTVAVGDGVKNEVLTMLWPLEETVTRTGMGVLAIWGWEFSIFSPLVLKRAGWLEDTGDWKPAAGGDWFEPDTLFDPPLLPPLELPPTPPPFPPPSFELPEGELGELAAGAAATGVFWVVEVSDAWDVITGPTTISVEMGRNLMRDDESSS